MKQKLLLRYRLTGSIPETVVERLRALPSVDILDQTPKMLKIEGDELEVEGCLASSPGWVIVPDEEVSYSLPDPRPKLRGPE